MNQNNRDFAKDRTRLLGRNVAIFYTDPLQLTKGQCVWLWNTAGRRYLDFCNNAPVVGHCNEPVTMAICQQTQMFDTLWSEMSPVERCNTFANCPRILSDGGGIDQDEWARPRFENAILTSRSRMNSVPRALPQ